MLLSLKSFTLLLNVILRDEMEETLWNRLAGWEACYEFVIGLVS